MPYIPIGSLIDAFAILGALFAVWKGGVAERYSALVVIANVAIGQSEWFAPGSGGVIRMINDGVTATILLGITVRYGALWMGGVMLFFAAQFAMHSYYLVMQLPNDYWHALINNIDFSGIIWCLIIGTVVAWRGRIRRERERAAVASSVAAPAQTPPAAAG